MTEKVKPVVPGYGKSVTETFVTLAAKGDYIAGTLVHVGEQQFGDRTVGRYVVERDGQRFVFLGSAQIDQMLGGRPIGYSFLLQYAGEERSRGGNAVKQFLLFEPD